MMKLTAVNSLINASYISSFTILFLILLCGWRVLLNFEIIQGQSCMLCLYRIERRTRRGLEAFWDWMAVDPLCVT
jgi:hypothetical protein